MSHLNIPYHMVVTKNEPHVQNKGVVYIMINVDVLAREIDKIGNEPIFSYEIRKIFHNLVDKIREETGHSYNNFDIFMVNDITIMEKRKWRKILHIIDSFVSNIIWYRLIDQNTIKQKISESILKAVCVDDQFYQNIIDRINIPSYDEPNLGGYYNSLQTHYMDDIPDIYNIVNDNTNNDMKEDLSNKYY